MSKCGFATLLIPRGGRSTHVVDLGAHFSRPPTMTTVVLVAHAPLASTFSGLGGHCFEQAAASLKVLDVQPNEQIDDVAQRLRALLPSQADAAVLVLADTLGATPYNGAKQVADTDPRVRVIAGLNLPMLWRTLCYLAEPIDKLQGLALDGGVEGINRSRPRAA